MQPNLQEIVDLIATTEEILKCKTLFFVQSEQYLRWSMQDMIYLLFHDM